MAEKIYKLNKLGMEDLLIGTGTEVQVRNGVELVVTKLNAKTLPFDETKTLKEALDLQYPSIDALTVVDTTVPSGKKINPAITTVANQPTYIEAVGTDLLDANSKITTVANDLQLLDDSKIKKVSENILAIQEVSADLKETVSEIEVVGQNLEKGDDSEIIKVSNNLDKGANSEILNAESNANTAVSAANAASTSESNAATSESNASTSESNAATSESNASSSASAAATSESNAATSASNASTSEANANSSKELAKKYAENDEDVEVETGTYSAKHYAKKAEVNGHRFFNSTTLGDFVVADNTNEMLINPVTFNSLTIGDGSRLVIQE